jgi:hypothetical protein
MDLWKSVREGFYDRFFILSIKNKKIFNQWIDNIDENETKSIDRYHQYRSIDPSPIVPIYAIKLVLTLQPSSKQALVQL